MKTERKKTKFRLLAFVLVAVYALSFALPVSAWADEGGSDANVDLVEDEMYCLGGGSKGGIGNRTVSAATSGSGSISSAMGGGIASDNVKKATAYSNLQWYPNAQSTVNTGRAKNNITPNTSATESHVVYKADAVTGKVTNYAVYDPNPKNPTGFDERIRYDGVGRTHQNSATGEELMPHVHDKSAIGGLRSPYMHELP